MHLISQIAENKRKILRLRLAGTTPHLYSYFLNRIHSHALVTNVPERLKSSHNTAYLRNGRAYGLQLVIRHTFSRVNSMIQPAALVRSHKGQFSLNRVAHSLQPTIGTKPVAIIKHKEPIISSRMNGKLATAQYSSSSTKGTTNANQHLQQILQRLKPVATVNGNTHESANGTLASTNKRQREGYAGKVSWGYKYPMIVAPGSSSTIVHTMSKLMLKRTPLTTILQQNRTYSTKLDANQWAQNNRIQFSTNNVPGETTSSTQLYKKRAIRKSITEKKSQDEIKPSFVTTPINVQTTVEDILYDIISKVKSMK